MLVSVSLALGSAGHVLAGGSLAHPSRIAVASMLLTVALLPLSRRERSWGSIVAILAGGQALTHLVSAFPPGPSDSATPHAFLCTLTGTGEAGHVSVPRLTLMAVAHLAATLLCSFWLRRGERAAWQAATRLGRRLAHALGPVVALPASTVPTAAVPRRPTADRRRLRPLPYGASRRGPPASLVTS